MGIPVFASAKKPQKALRFTQLRQLRRQQPNVGVIDAAVPLA